MKFNDYTDSYVWDNRDGMLKAHGINNITDLNNYFAGVIRKTGGVMGSDYGDIVRYLLISREMDWIEAKRPYYDVYPSMIPILEGLKLDFSLKDVTLPMGFRELLVRFPVGHDVQCIFFSLEKVEGEYRCLMNSYFMSEESNDEDRVTITTMWQDDATGQSAVDYLKGCDSGMSDYKLNQMTRFFKIFIGICLIGNDPEIVERQVLSKDLIKLTDENYERLADKAKKRGKFGFSFGAQLEKIPHLRRPHPCWVPYGPGRKYRKLKLRKGSIVHREKIEKMPTGHLDNA